jgi:hypothetical protein
LFLRGEKLGQKEKKKEKEGGEGTEERRSAITPP